MDFWLMGAVWLLDFPKASSLKIAKSSNKACPGNLTQCGVPRNYFKQLSAPQIYAIFGFEPPLFLGGGQNIF